MFGPRPPPGQHPDLIAFPTPTVSAPAGGQLPNSRGDPFDDVPPVYSSPPTANPQDLPAVGHPVPSNLYANGNAHSTPAGHPGSPFVEQDIAQTRYTNPYAAEADIDADRRANNATPTVGPWDSASQRSLSVSETEYRGTGHMEPLNGHPKSRPSKATSAGGLSYIDEDGAYYSSPYARPSSAVLLSNRLQAHDEDVEMRGLVNSAAAPGRTGDGAGGDDCEGYHGKFNDYAEQPDVELLANKENSVRRQARLYDWLLFPTGLDRLLALFCIKLGRYPVEQAIEQKRRGLGRQRWPVASWALTIAMTGVMIYALLRNKDLTGSAIATQPQFNYMIGPQPEVLINIGARFIPCMKYVDALPPTFQLSCLNDTSNPPTTSCPLSEICGHGLLPGETPNQTWRFVFPIFLHVGVVHLLVNMLGQMIIGTQVEREMGTVPFLIVYFASGVYGFLLGGNFSRTGIPSAGASGALFGANACILVDLLLHWKYEERPKLRAFFLAVEFIIGIAIGYIPNAVDGLAHLGGYAMGILTGIILYPSISETKRHRYIVWAFRVVAFVLAVLAFILTARNFFTEDPNAACTWCRFLSCIPTSSNNHCTGTGITVTSTTSTRRSWDLL